MFHYVVGARWAIVDNETGCQRVESFCYYSQYVCCIANAMAHPQISFAYIIILPWLIE
jgi:hypothetical protein